ncbi:enolase, partial [Lecanoromycetidae sp. Uapishka_2]
MIRAIHASQRLDSRGKPTVQVQLKTDHGSFQAIVPSGASKGDYEAVELRDGDAAAYGGNGVLKAVSNVEKIIAPALIDKNLNVTTDLDKIDHLMIELDGTDDKSRLGANAILGVSMACARAGAATKGVPLYEFIRQLSHTKKPYKMPVPFFNVLNGGVHSGNGMAFQEFMIAPIGASSMADAVRMGAEVYQRLKEVVRTKYGSSAIGIGDEGGFAPPISRPTEALDLLVIAIEQCNYTNKVKIGIDPASQEFLAKDMYNLGFKDPSSHGDELSANELGSLYTELLAKYPIVLLEDPFGQDDWEAWENFCKTCRVELVGDDLLATNTKRIKHAEEHKACNALLLKINQIGTITESIEAYGWRVFVSHRSGETTDDFIADLTVGLATGHLKSGSPCRGERVSKYNRLMDIEDEIKAAGEEVIYAGKEFY